MCLIELDLTRETLNPPSLTPISNIGNSIINYLQKITLLRILMQAKVSLAYLLNLFVKELILIYVYKKQNNKKKYDVDFG